jgi:outer membrane receptor for monomeric catechols
VDDPSVDAFTPIYVPGYSLVTGVIGYKWKISRQYELNLNLRVSNLFNNDKVIYTDGTLTLRPKDGDFTSPARETTYAPYAYQTPRSYSLTARVNF